MKKVLLATSLLTALAFMDMAAARAQMTDDAPVGKAAGTFLIRGRIIGVIPENSSSSLSGALTGGSVSTSNSVAPEADLSYFVTDNIAFELIAATTKHDLYASHPALGSNYHVGSTWVLPPTLLAQYHFMPHQKFSPYVGAGLNVTFFYSTSPANNAVLRVVTAAVRPSRLLERSAAGAVRPIPAARPEWGFGRGWRSGW
jgi:outer membrane protein